MRFFNRITRLYKRLFWSLEKQAREAGVKMGSHNLIASRFWSTEPYLIKIGSYCQLTEDTHIYTHGGAIVARDKFPDFDVFGKVELGNRVYVGAGAMIMPGVTIGDNCIIGAGSVVNKDIPSNSVAAGTPCKVICTLEDYLDKCRKLMDISPVYGEEYTLRKNISMEKRREQYDALKDCIGFVK